MKPHPLGFESFSEAYWIKRLTHMLQSNDVVVIVVVAAVKDKFQ